MTLTLNIPPDLETRIKQEAQRLGIDPVEYAQRVLVNSLPQSQSNATLESLFAEWDAEDRTDDPGELARRNQELAELKRSMNQNRAESDGSAARRPFP